MSNNMNAEQALERREEREATQQRKPTLFDQIRRMQPEYQAAMPKGAEAAQLIRDAITLVKTNPKLAQCDEISVLGGLMNIAQLNLRVAVLGQAWLLPFWDYKAGPLGNNGKPKGGFAAQLVIGYQGFIELAHRSPNVASVVARTAYENDLFEVELGTDDRILHKPLMDGDRGAPVAYYSVAKFTNGGHTFWWMTQSEMEKHRDKYALAKNKQGEIVGPWRDEFEGMSQKTVVRKLAKYMPKSTELAHAIAADESVRIDLDPGTMPGAAAQFIDGEVVDEDAEAPDAR
jgi:recombination protein RecT